MGTHGGLNVVHAIEKSCNTFFFNLILKNGFERWTKYGRMFGFGKKRELIFTKRYQVFFHQLSFMTKFMVKGNGRKVMW